MGWMNMEAKWPTAYRLVGHLIQCATEHMQKHFGTVGILLFWAVGGGKLSSNVQLNQMSFAELDNF